MASKIKFTSLAQLREYAEHRSGGDDKLFKDKTSSEQAWSSILDIIRYREIDALRAISETMKTLGTTCSLTKAGIYNYVAERINVRE